MTRIARQFPAIAAVSLVAMLGIGCASTANLEQMVKDAQQTANEALDAANKAQQTADQASSTASSAAQKADQAMSAASSASSAVNDAQSCCSANTERLNRMFEKSMRK